MTKFTLYTMVVFVAILGLMELYDGLFPERVPQINLLGNLSEERKLASQTDDWRKFTTPEENWEKLRPAVKVLDKVCPEAADWVINCYSGRRIVWVTRYDGTYARYDYINRTLYLNETFLRNNNGLRATTLAHEFRHSRQNATKGVKRVLFTMLTGTDPTHVVENDAYAFQREVHLAIFE